MDKGEIERPKELRVEKKFGKSCEEEKPKEEADLVLFFENQQGSAAVLKLTNSPSSSAELCKLFFCLQISVFKYGCLRLSIVFLSQFLGGFPTFFLKNYCFI